MGNVTDGSQKLSANGRLVLGQLAEVHADSVIDGKKMVLASLLINLDEQKFMKTEGSLENANINKAMVSLEKCVFHIFS